MRIACISTSKIPSTTANSIQVMKACSALVKLGHEVCLWVPGNPETDWGKLSGLYGLDAEFEIRGVPAVQFLRRYDFAVLAAFQSKAWKADLVCTWLLQSGIHALRQKIPVVLELHDRPMGRFGPGLFHQFMTVEGRKRIALITSALQRALENEFSATFKPGEAVIAPNGVELDKYAELPTVVEARKTLGFKEIPSVLFSGHLYAGRGTDLMLHLAEKLPRVQFIWVGGRREDVEHWREKALQQGIKNIVLTGFIDNSKLPLYLASGDILIMPYEKSIAGSSGGNSADICSPMKMFEYLAAGRTIVSSDLPVIHEVLDDSMAIFCPPDDLESWTKAISQLIDDSKLRRQLGIAAKTASVNYSWTARAKKILDGFEIE